MTTLRDGSTALDPRLDRLVQFDPRSRAYPVRELVDGKAPRSYTWRCEAWNDQGREGACVGFAWSHELAARPVVRPTSEAEAMAIYRRAQVLDQWPGEAYSGTSVIAGAQAVQERGGLGSYRWAFGLEDLILAVGYTGPAVLGVNWYTGMFNPGPDGYIRVTGSVAGGHAILCRGVSLKTRSFLLHNSWSRDWGQDGTCRISFDDLGRLLAEDGEACLPIERA